MLTQGGGDQGFLPLPLPLSLPLPLPPMPSLVTDGKWKPNVELAPNCPRCDSSNTKFCYYNNYSLTQPRYFCKNCRRYWTKGGSLRNVPIGGGCRKYRRGRSSLRISSNSSTNGVTSMSSTLDRSRLPSVASSSMRDGTRSSDGSTIDLAQLYAKFLNHDQPEESDPRRLEMPELPGDFNPSIHLSLPQSSSGVVSLEPNTDPLVQFLREESVGASQCLSDQSTESHFDEMHQVFLGEFNMNHKQEERVLQFMSLDSNGYGFQPLPTEDLVVQGMFWSHPHPHPPLPNSNFPWQSTPMQRFEPVPEDQPTLHSNPSNGNNWSSFDLPQF